LCVFLGRYDGAEGWTNVNGMTLAIGFDNGRLQIMNFYDESHVIKVDTEIEVWKEERMVVERFCFYFSLDL
jgi:homospermidine synthase